MPEIETDGAATSFIGYVKRQNFRYWSDANLRQLRERPLPSGRVRVWSCVGRFGMISPYFFEEDGHAVTVNSGCYVHMLHNFLVPEVKRRGINQRAVWFQQDGDTAHTARASMTVM
jgi:hypothetical protein